MAGPQEGKPHYDAFLSYRHGADNALAAALQHGIHRLARAWYQLPTLRVFRDQTSLAANPDLWATIEAALRDSGRIILLASPESADSPWVRREIAFWQRHRTPGTFLIALTGGEIVWDHDAGDFDWARTTALPEQLRGWFPAEPLWVDLRDPRQLTLRDPRFRDQVGTLAAAVLGIPKDRLESRDIRAHRIARRVQALVIVVLLGLTLGLSVVVHQANQQRDIAAARAAEAQAENLRADQPQAAIRLGVAALNIAPSAAARTSLITTLAQTHFAGMAPEPVDSEGGHADVNIAVFSPDRRLMADDSPTGGNAVALWNVADPFHPVQVSTLTTASGGAFTVSGVVFSPDGRTVAVIGTDDTVALWDVTDPAHPRRTAVLRGLVDGRRRVEAVAIGHDGTTLAAVGQDPDDNTDNGMLALWDIADPARPRQLGGQTGVFDDQALAFSPDDRTLVSASSQILVRPGPATPQSIVHNSGATLWNVTDRAHPAELKRLPLWGNGIAFSPDGKLLALGYGDNTVLWDVGTTAAPRRLAVLGGHTDNVQTIAFGPDGRLLTSAGLDGTAVIWNVADPAAPAQLTTLSNAGNGTGPEIEGVAFSPDGREVLTVDGLAGITTWRVASRAQFTPVATLSDSAGITAAVAFSPDGRTLAVTNGFTGTVTLWNFADPTAPVQLATLPGEPFPVLTVAFSRDGQLLATGDENGRLVLWDVTDRARPRQVATITINGGVTVNSVAFSPTSDVLVADGGAATGTVNPYLPPSKGWATIWNVRDPAHPARVGSIPDVVGQLGQVTIGPDGKTVAVDGNSGWLWDISNPAAPTKLPGDLSSQDTAFSPSGTIAAATQPDNTTVLTDIGDQHVLATLSGQHAPITSVAFHPGGQLLATASEDHTTVLWDVADPGQPARLATLTGQSNNVTGVAFSPDGRWLVTASVDGTVDVWNLGDLPAFAAADPASLACQLANGGLSTDEWQEFVPELSYRDTCSR